MSDERSDEPAFAESTRRRRRSRGGIQETGEKAYEARSRGARPRSEELQQRLGNAGLLQLRALQRRTFSPEEVPDGIKGELGVTAGTEAQARHVDRGLDAADATLAPTAGQPLDRDVRTHAEHRLGVSLDGVNVVQKADAATGPLEAHALAASDGAGRHSIALSSAVDLGSPDGQFTLMHELSHVAQQKRSATDGLDGLGGDEAVRDRLEREADASAARLLEEDG